MKKILALTSICVLAACTQQAFAKDTVDVDKLKHVTQELVMPPALPKHDQVAKGGPVIVDVKMTIEEKKLQITPDASIWAMTFNGSVPGPIIVVHQDDYVELTLVNPATNSLPHNIDFHASTGAMGGGELTHVSPGEQVVLRFKATKPGVFVYHCAPGGAMVPLHVVSGMNGAIMVLPRDGLKDENGKPLHYDKAFYIAEQDYYIPKDENGKYKEYNSPVEGFADMTEVMKGLVPTHLMFNGVAGALTGDNSMKASVGDRVLIITAQANRDTRMHLIGGHADYVWAGGSFNDKPLTDYESWSVVAGSAVAAFYTFHQPGTYAFLNHNLIEAFMFNAISLFKVDGKWDDDLMKQVSKPTKIPAN